jgi:hypothetical protein
MLDLHDRLQELADAATRDGATPGPAHAIRRGRQRRRRIVAATASLLVVALAAGGLVSGCLRVARELPSAGPPPAVPSLARLDLHRELPGRDTYEDRMFKDLASAVRHCPGGAKVELIGYLRSREFRRVVMVVAKPPAPGASGVCWTSGVFELDGAGSFGAGKGATLASAPLTATGSSGRRYGTVEGQVAKRAAWVRVEFRDRRRPLDLPVLEAGRRYPVNFFAAIFPETSSRPDANAEWSPARITAFDARGHKVAGCTVGPPFDAQPQCPAE